jgi:hypothetical protein
MDDFLDFIMTRNLVMMKILNVVIDLRVVMSLMSRKVTIQVRGIRKRRIFNMIEDFSEKRFKVIMN